MSSFLSDPSQLLSYSSSSLGCEGMAKSKRFPPWWEMSVVFAGLIMAEVDPK